MVVQHFKGSKWLWLSWWSGRLQYQRSAVQIQSPNIEHLFTVNCIEKTKINKEEAGNDPFKKLQG